ncbi:YdcF family protein [Luteimonas sp. SJ-92]|uniref:YdcF family protein n=1 Tax=Luteimonas salinisoli TaxID=2752307 RepID=A0A853JAQ2_9GAMM|nr:YdcF family protein [Luteimonas salinisoli]NZA25747.1 YdcF family protein [Luteimonas salinisoli]
MSLAQFLAPLAAPFNLGLCLLALAAPALLLRWRKCAAGLALAALLWPLWWSLPQAANWITATLERRHPPVADAALPPADAIVVLGGGTGLDAWFDAGDPRAERLATSRVARAARVWHRGDAPVLVLSGGARRADAPSEAATMAQAVRKLGVPETALVLEEDSRSTRENARRSAQLLRERGARRVLLVTSAMHMPRAAAQFERAGLQVAPVPADSEIVSGKGDWGARWVPTRTALRRSGRALKEYAGLLAMRLER